MMESTAPSFTVPDREEEVVAEAGERGATDASSVPRGRSPAAAPLPTLREKHTAQRRKAAGAPFLARSLREKWGLFSILDLDLYKKML